MTVGHHSTTIRSKGENHGRYFASVSYKLLFPDKSGAWICGAISLRQVETKVMNIRSLTRK